MNGFRYSLTAAVVGSWLASMGALPCIAADLVHRFNFDNETAEDSVLGLDGDLIGDPSFATDAPDGGTAIVLEGSQYVRVDDEVDFGEEFSVTMWVQPDSSALGIQNLFGNAPGGWDTDGFKLYYNTWSNPSTADGAFILETGDGQNVGSPGDAVRTEGEVIFDDVWYHVGATISVDSGEVYMYVDGELQDTSGGLNVDMKLDGPFEIGSMLGDWDLHGQIDDVQIYQGILTDDEVQSLYDTPGSVIGVVPSAPGDYNGDGAVDVADINLQGEAMRAPNPDLGLFDENADGAVDASDRSIWVRNHAGTWLGDSNLDGEFNSSDFVFVFTQGKYESGAAANWEEGDRNGDGQFGSSDFVTAFADGGYESGPRQATQAVPEPTTFALLLLALPMFNRRSRGRD